MLVYNTDCRGGFYRWCCIYYYFYNAHPMSFHLYMTGVQTRTKSKIASFRKMMLGPSLWFFMIYIPRRASVSEVALSCISCARPHATPERPPFNRAGKSSQSARCAPPTWVISAKYFPLKIARNLTFSARSATELR